MCQYAVTNLLLLVSVFRDPHQGTTTEVVTHEFKKELGSGDKDREVRKQLAATINGTNQEAV